MAEDEQVTSTEQAEASPPPVDDSAPVPESPPEAPAEPQTPEPDAEEQQVNKVLEEVTATHFPDVAAPPEDDKVVLTKAQHEEELRRAQQSAGDRARAEADEQRRIEQQAAQHDAQLRAQLRQRVGERAQLGITQGELPADFADGVAAEYEGMFFEKGRAFMADLASKGAEAAFFATDAFRSATAEDLEPLSKPPRNVSEYFGNMFAAHDKAVERRVRSGIEAEVEKKANALAKTKAQAMTKEALAKLRVGQPNGDLPVGTAPRGAVTSADMAAHRNDPIGPDGYSDWYRANREKILTQTKTK